MVHRDTNVQQVIIVQQELLKKNLVPRKRMLRSKDWQLAYHVHEATSAQISRL